MNLKLLASTNILPQLKPSNNALRRISTKFFKPHPRPYKRRLFESALAPVIPPPEKNRQCYIRANYKLPEKEILDIEVAHANVLRKDIIEMNLRVMIVCQLLMADRKTKMLGKNHLCLNGLESRVYGKNILKIVFNGTPLESLDVLWTSHNYLLFGSNVEHSLKTLFNVVPTIKYLVPLVIVVDDRIITLKQAKEALRCTEGTHHSTTAKMLGRIPLNVTQMLDRTPNEVSLIIDQMLYNSESDKELTESLNDDTKTDESLNDDTKTEESLNDDTKTEET